MGCVGPVGQTTNGRLGAHHLIIRIFFVTGSLRMETSWSDLLRNPCSVNCHASHACEATSQSARGRYVVKAASQCACAYLDRSLAMCLLKPSSLPQCVLAYPMCLRNAILAYIQGVFAMRLRHPMRLHNASGPPNASARSNASMRQRLPMCLRLLDLF